MLPERFYLTTHEVSWLGRLRDVRLFISTNRFERQKTYPRATTPWALDSGGFTELSQHGYWRMTPGEYVGRVRRYMSEVGMMEWASPMDSMCEESIRKKTGKTTVQHQIDTIDNAIELRMLAPEVPWRYVLQGDEDAESYLRHRDMYAARGIDLSTEAVVGVGSVCRRQSREEIASIMETLHGDGLRLHGYGVKTEGLLLYAEHLESSDSLAWSTRARKLAWHGEPEPFGNLGCTHASHANCMKFALKWRESVMQVVRSRAGQ